ncbi:MAG: cold shock domain-containing protein [Acetobacteraceae bacterium]|nr:cold shock domain-containing protein [Acetobacteraceae bacterium]
MKERNIASTGYAGQPEWLQEWEKFFYCNSGVIKWYNGRLGWIQRDSGGLGILFFAAAVVDRRPLQKGQRVTFEVWNQGSGKLRAIKVEVSA